MGKNSKIGWTHHTFNPWWGCTQVSPACDNCYAKTFDKRVGGTNWGKDSPRRFFGEKHWAEPAKLDREAAKAGERHRVFCGSMCDLMEDYNGEGHLVRETIEESREWLRVRIERTPNLDWLLLTKRPQNFRRFLPKAWLAKPLPNVWGMATVESEDYLWRAAELLRTPFAVRGLSVEPLLAPLDLSGYLGSDFTGDLMNGPCEEHPGVDWVIVGAESGHHARPMNEDWVRSIRDQCLAAGVAFFYKQNVINGIKIEGPMLDGRQWQEIPQVHAGRKK